MLSVQFESGKLNVVLVFHLLVYTFVGEFLSNKILPLPFFIFNVLLPRRGII
jgi:hypothetical protein